MSNDTEVPVEKFTIYFTGKIVFDAAMMDCEGRDRTAEDVVHTVIQGIESEIHNNLTYDDEDREEYDLVQQIHELDISEATSPVGQVPEQARDFEPNTGRSETVA
jgi:hypothetical protein